MGRWVVPLIILYYIFKRIDFAEFKANLMLTDPWLVTLGLAVSPLLILTGAIRWRCLLSTFNSSNIPYSYLLEKYWVGSSLGFFSPGAIGFDAFRVYISSPRFGSYTHNIILILIEKYIALFTCMLLIAFTYPFVSIPVESEVKKVFYLAYVVLFFLIVIFFIFYYELRNSIIKKILRKIYLYFDKSFGRLFAKLNFNVDLEVKLFYFKSIVDSLKEKNLLKVIIFSFGIQLISAVKSQIFFCSVDYDLPFVVNILIAPTLYFIFLLPVSFGSLGIREGVYILLFGLFGVPMEISLLVSFLNLFGLLLNNLIGVIIMLFTGTHSFDERKVITEKSLNKKI